MLDIDMPSNISKQNNLQDSTMEFYRIKTKPPKNNLNVKTFNNFERYIEKIETISGKYFYKKITYPAIQKQGE